MITYYGRHLVFINFRLLNDQMLWSPSCIIYFRLLNDHVLWSPSCGRVKEMQPAQDELSNEERLLHSDLLVRIKGTSQPTISFILTILGIYLSYFYAELSIDIQKYLFLNPHI